MTHRSPIRAAAFGADSHTMATGLEDGTINLWHIQPYDGSIRDLQPLAQTLAGRTISPDGFLKVLSSEQMAPAWTASQD